MQVLTKEELKEVKGGLSLSGTILNQFNNLIKLLMEAGQNLGSALRRMESGAVCPLE